MKSTQTSGIVVYLYHDIDTRQNSYPSYIHESKPGRTFTAEELCLAAAEQVGICPVTFHHFALATVDLKHWLSPNKILTCSDTKVQEFIFRFRFKVAEIADREKTKLRNLIRNDTNAFNYYFLQSRDDLVNDHILNIYGKDISTKTYLGLAVIDMFRLGIQENLHTSEMVATKYSALLAKFLPKSALHSYSKFFDQMRLKKMLKQSIRKLFNESSDLSSTNAANQKLRYMVGLFEAAPIYGSEFYPVSGGRVWVDPHNEETPGIYICSDDTSQPEPNVICKIEDVQTVTIRPSESGVTRVHLDMKDGQPTVLNFNADDDAESFSSAVDGYRRLMIDFYFNPCFSILSPMLKMLQDNKCHGPVDDDWAIRKLRSRGRDQQTIPGMYLLKQSVHSYYTFSLLLCVEGRNDPRIYQIIRHLHEDGKTTYQVLVEGSGAPEPVFESLTHLRRHYTRKGHPWLRLNEIIHPGSQEQCPLLLCSSNCEDKFVQTVVSAPPPPAHVPVFVQGSRIDIEGKIGESAIKMTEVYKARTYLQSKSSKLQVVAVKKLKSSSGNLLEALQHSANTAAFWNCLHIVKIHAFCLEPPFRMIMEYMSLGSLQDYLRDPKNHRFGLHELVCAAAQLAEALFYLAENHWVHGNIRCRNILVSHLEDAGPVIKLADPGLLHLYHGVEIWNAFNKERLPWLAPELYHNIKGITTETDVYAFGVTLWEILSIGDRPFKDLRTPEEMQVFISKSNELPVPLSLEKNDTSDNKCIWDTKDELMNVIRQCRAVNPDTRIAPACLLRDVRHMHFSVVPSHLQYESIGPVDEDQAPTYVNEQSEALRELENDWNRTIEEELLSGHDNRMYMNRPLTPGHTRIPDIPDVSSSNEKLRVELPTPKKDVPLPKQPEGAPHVPVGPDMTLPRVDSVVPMEVWEVDFSHVQLLRERRLGAGHYGEVYLAILHQPNQRPVHVAAKNLKPEMHDKCYGDFRQEMEIMVNLRHPNIVEFKGMCRNPDVDNELYLIMEYVDRGSLNKYLNRHKDTTDLQLLCIANDIAHGMSYLSKHKIVHRDLAARNVLLALTGESNGLHENRKFIAKVCDFGLARMANEGDYYKTRRNGELPLGWCSPEAIGYKLFSSKSDVWSFGVLLWEMFNRCQKSVKDTIAERVKGEYNRYYHILERGWRLPKGEEWPADVKDLIRKCWHWERKQRCSFEDIMCILEKLINDRIKECRDSETDLFPEPELQMPAEEWRSMMSVLTGSCKTLHEGTTEVDYNLDWNNLQIERKKELGKGHFGVVFKGTLTQLGRVEKVAVKQLLMTCSETERKDFQKEIETMKNLHDKNIVELKGVVVDPYKKEDMYLVLEYVECGSLVDYMKKYTCSEIEKLHLALDIASGMQYLSDNGFIHRDLAARNVLITKMQKETRECVPMAKLADFGLSRRVDENDYYKFATARVMPLGWWAPETIQEQKFYKLSDVWSFGVTLWELYTNCGRAVTEEVERICANNPAVYYKKLKEDGWRLPIESRWKTEIIILIKECWKFSWKERKPFEQICSHIQDAIEHH